MTHDHEKQIRRPRRLRRYSALLAATALVTTAIGTQSASAETSTAGTCQEVTLKVSLTEGGTKDQTVAGTYCTPKTWAAGPHQIEIVTAGGSYDRNYWDFPAKYPQFSYVDRALKSGRATFAYDRISTGKSSRPAAAVVSIPAHAVVLHQIIQWARNTQGFSKVIITGHSIGSVVVLQLAATHPDDADQVVVTGALHFAALGLGFALIPVSAYPAALDPKFLGRVLDPLYLTTVPNARKNLFYTPDADPAVIAKDEELKDVMSTVELDTAIAQIEIPALLNVSQNITAPVLVVTGQEDALFCNLLVNCHDPEAVRAHEAPFYANAASFTSVTVPNTAHDLTTAPTAGQSFSIIDNWIRTH